MSDFPLFPWQASDDSSQLTQEIKDPLSPAKIDIPKCEGLLLNEVLFTQWAVTHYEFLGDGDDSGLSSKPHIVQELIDFCHKFLCLRFEKADWVKGELLFEDKPLSPSDSLNMTLPNGQKKAASLYVLYLIYGFFTQEQAAWLGKSSRMMQTIQNAIAPSIGETSIGESSEPTQVTPDSLVEPSGVVPPTSSKKPLKAPRKQKSAG